MRLVIALLLMSVCLAGQTAKVDTSTPIGQAFVRMYSFDFPGAHAILDQEVRRDPAFSLTYSVKAACLLFSEMNRLKILQVDFFEDDDKVVDRKKLVPDPAVRAEFLRLIDVSREKAEAMLAKQPGDREAWFTLCMSSGLVTDYAALVERRRFGSFALAKQTQAYALKLLALNPPYYDAHMSVGSAEYVVGCLPFFLRWFIRIDRVEGSKERAIEHLQLVAERGRYFGPFARILLAVVNLREKRPREAEELLIGLSEEFPENLLIRKELARAGELVRRGKSAAGN